MTCGSKYAHLLVTAGGKTPDDPWDWYAGPTDYDDWYDVVHTVDREVFRRWNWLLAIEDKLSKLDEPPVDGPYPQRDQLLYLLQDFATKRDDIKHVILEPLELTWTWEPGIRKCIGTARDGTCVLEMLDAATTYYQRPLLPESAPKRKPGTGASGGSEDAGGGLGGVLMTGALAVGGVLLWRRHKRKERR